MRCALVLAMAASGCGFQAQRGGGGDGGGPLATCTSTKLRGFEPLGGASPKSRHGGLAQAGANLAAVWEQPTGLSGAGAGSIFFALVDNLGRVSGAKQLASGQDPVLLRTDHLVLLYRNGADLLFQALDDTGAAMGAAVTVYSGISDELAAVFDGTKLGIVIGGAAGDPYQAYWLTAALDGTLRSGPTKIADGGNNSLLPSLAWTGSSYAVAWVDTRPGTPAIYYARFDAAFQRLGPDLPLSPAGMRGSFPSVGAQEAGGVVVCYQLRVDAGNDDIACQRLDDGGHVTASPRLSMTAFPSQDPEVVTHGHTTWVLWDEGAPSGQSTLNWQFLDDSGMPLNATAFDTMTPGFIPHAAVTSDALYATQYDVAASGSSVAEVLTINCY